jgi:hypothetical protein
MNGYDIHKKLCITIQKTLNVIKKHTKKEEKKMLAGMQIFKIRYHTSEVAQK